MKKTFNDFTKSYSLSKTLRFELIPVGKTADNIVKSGLLEEDAHRAESYKIVKKLIDEYHKAFIDRVLSSFKIPVISKNKKNSLEEYIVAYHAKQHDENAKALFETLEKNMRKMIAQKLSKDEYFNRIFQKELIREDLKHFIQIARSEQLNGLDKEQATLLIDEFKEFTTYFQGFHKNRKNMYSEEEQTTAISHRLINENLPRFIDNMAVFDKLSRIPELQDKMQELFRQFESNLNVTSIAEMFRLEYFNVLLTQTQIDVYNSIIGGRTEKQGMEKIQGLNEYINLYNQHHNDVHLPKLKVLYKQILSDRNSISWLPEEFKSDDETLQAIKDFYEELEENLLGEKSLKLLLESLAEYKLDGIYVRNDLQLTELSQKTFGNWCIIPNAIKENIKRTVPAQKRREDNEQYEERINALFKKHDSLSIQYINDCISLSFPNEQHTIQEYFATLGAINNETEQRENLFYQIANRYAEVKELLSVPYPKGCNLAQDKINVEKIKELLDAIKSLQHFIKPLLGTGNESDKDETFYGELNQLWTQLDQVTPLYNKVRNYLTRKPYSQDKIKLNFQNSTLLDGWDENKEYDNSSIILRKGNDYFLGIMHKDYRKVLKTEWPSDGECFEKLVYKFVPDPSRQLPHVYFSKKGIAIYKPQSEILEIKATKTHTKGENFSLKDCHALIDYFKSSINRHEDWKQFGFHFSETSSYHDISEFYKEVEQQGYKITYRDVSEAFVNQLVKEGKLFLFKIYNKDFSPHSKGTPNMHTLYWRALFSEQNLNDVVYKLNGKAEVFYRKHSLAYSHPTHRANQPIKNKNKNNDKKESVFKYDIIKGSSDISSDRLKKIL